MNVTKFGKFLVDKGYTTEEGVIKALNIQRKREVIPIGEIALQRELLSVKQIFDILNEQTPECGKRFGEIAVEMGYLSEEDVLRLINFQNSFRLPIGEILVELGEFDKAQLKQALSEFYSGRVTSQLFCKVCDAIFPGTSSPDNDSNCPKCGGQLLSKAHGHTLQETEDKSIKTKDVRLPQNTPFLLVCHCCPICGHDNNLVTIKQSLFFFTGKDVDMKPTKYEWHDQGFSHIDPPLYNIWQCSKCFFTASRRYFDNPVLDTNIHMFDFRQLIVDLYKKRPETLNVINTLKGSTHPLKMNYFSAIKHYLLAIYLLEHVDKIKNRDSIPLARYYLNLAWLYRDANKTDTQRKMSEEALSELQNKLGSNWESFPINEQDALEESLSYYDKAFYSSSFIESKHIEHNILQITARIYIKLGKREQAKKDLNESIKYAEEYLTLLDTKLAKNKTNKAKLKNIKQRINKTKNFIAESKMLFSKYIAI